METPDITDHQVVNVVLTSADLVRGAEAKREKVKETLLNILEGRIQNPNTRNAYKIAWRAFFQFCSEYKLELDRVKPYHFGLFLKRHLGSVATQRQHLAAVRLLFDHLLEQGVVESNPAARAKPPRLQRESSHTPIFEEEEIKALFSVLAYSWARVSAVAALKVEDYYERKGQRWLRFREKRGKIHEVPVHSKARDAVDQWLAASGLVSNPSAPLFPAFAPDKKTFAQDKKTSEIRHLDRRGISWLVQARAKASGLEKKVCCHSFRATGITQYMNRGGVLDIAQRIAGHAQLSTTKIYDRSQDRVTIAEIERVSFEPAPEPS